jgi:hypothetical protein
MNGSKGAFLYKDVMTGVEKMVSVHECLTECNSHCKKPVSKNAVSSTNNGKNGKVVNDSNNKKNSKQNKSFIEQEDEQRPILPIN